MPKRSTGSHAITALFSIRKKRSNGELDAGLAELGGRLQPSWWFSATAADGCNAGILPACRGSPLSLPKGRPAPWTLDPETHSASTHLIPKNTNAPIVNRGFRLILDTKTMSFKHLEHNSASGAVRRFL